MNIKKEEEAKIVWFLTCIQAVHRKTKAL